MKIQELSIVTREDAVFVQAYTEYVRARYEATSKKEMTKKVEEIHKKMMKYESYRTVSISHNGCDYRSHDEVWLFQAAKKRGQRQLQKGEFETLEPKAINTQVTIELGLMVRNKGPLEAILEELGLKNEIEVSKIQKALKKEGEFSWERP